MDFLTTLIIFVLFWWALLATIFSFQLHLENENYARRLGKRVEIQKMTHTNYITEILNSIILPVSVRSFKFNQLIKGNWILIKEGFAQRYADLSDYSLMYVEGNETEIIGKLQK